MSRNASMPAKYASRSRRGRLAPTICEHWQDRESERLARQDHIVIREGRTFRGYRVQLGNRSFDRTC
jgi:hypothetical protein